MSPPHGEEALKLEIEELIELGEDVVISGFEEAEIDLLLLDDTLAALTRHAQMVDSRNIHA